MATKISDLILYRYRFMLGYVLISLAGLGLLWVALFVTPGGIDSAEIHSVIITSSLSVHSLDPANIINAPYHLLQALSMQIFGINNFAIKLPSAFIAILTVIGAVGLLGQWFRRNVAVLTIIIALTTGEFLFLAQNGTPAIMPIFWSVWILHSALMVSRRANFSLLWKVILFGTAALSLYTPLSIYIIVAVVSAGLLHPHLRYLIRQMTWWRVLLAVLFAVGIITPLAFAIDLNPTIFFKIIGLPNHIDLAHNLAELSIRYTNFMDDSNSPDLTPIYGLGSILLALLGVVRFVTTKYTARNYILTALIVLLVPAVLLNPKQIGVTFVPIILLVAMGIDLLFRRWYSLFPRNPYARLAGLIPLAVLIGGMITSGIVRYVDSYTYDPTKVQQFSFDLNFVNRELSSLQPGQTLTLVSTKRALPLYQVVAQHTDKLNVVTSMPTELPSTGPVLMARGVQYPPRTDNLSRILTNDMTLYGDRFYLYQK